MHLRMYGVFFVCGGIEYEKNIKKEHDSNVAFLYNLEKC